MALITEYALTPDVFDVTSYSGEEICRLHLQTLKDVLLQEGLVRNLHGGEWARSFKSDHRPWHKHAKELLRKLTNQQRLIAHHTHADIAPSTDAEWCDEALVSHKTSSLGGIITTGIVANDYKAEPLVAAIDRLSTTTWWTSRSPSTRIGRTVADYQSELALVLRHANSIMFIDPHVDPERPQYQDFTALMQAAGGRSPSPLIEIHRVCYRGSGPNRQILDLDELEMAFRRRLQHAASSAGVTVDVFIWDDFHDRYLISNLVGISIPNGFDTTSAPGVQTTWTRLGRNDRDDIQREFDPASRRHTLRRKFRLG